MNRRESVAALLVVGAAAPLARGQASAKPPVVGILSPQPTPTPEAFAKFQYVARFHELGWIDGQTFRIERGFSGHEGRLPEFAAELVRKRVDLIWALGPEAALAAARMTKTIPIVFWGVGYPVEQGLVDSLGRPGRNVTGVTAFTGIGIYQKQLEILQQIVPSARRVALIRTPSAVVTLAGEDSGAHRPMISVAQTLGMELRELPVHRDEDFDAIFKEIVDFRAQALWVGGTMLTLRNRSRILEFASRHRIPAIYFDRSWVELGGLVSYGANGFAGVLRSIDHADRILRGARPAGLPVESPSTYELVLNLKTAKALGLTVPQSVLLRADRVIK